MDHSKKLDDSSASSSSSSSSEHTLRTEMVVEVKKEAVCSWKAEREKLRRDKLKEQFLELGNALDPNRPKSDNASILTDTIQMLKDVMNQVDKLKAEHETLSQESRQLIQEKSELREEKAALKSDIEILNAQYQHRIRSTMVPWIQRYSYPIPVVSYPLIEQASVQQQVSKSMSSDKGNGNNKNDVGLELHASSLAQQDVSGKEKKGKLIE